MGLFDTTNAYGGGAPNTQVMSNLELEELRTLPPGVDYSVLPPSKIPEKAYGSPSVFTILSHEKYAGLNISLGDRYLREAEESWGDLNRINYEHEGPRHITFDNTVLPVIVEYQMGDEKKFAYASASQITPQIINFSGIISETPMFSALAPEGKEEITLADVPSSTIRIVDPSLEGMAITNCVSVGNYKLPDEEAKRLLNEAFISAAQPAIDKPGRSI